MIADPEGDTVRDETRVEALEAERQQYTHAAEHLLAEAETLRAENALLRKALSDIIDHIDSDFENAGFEIYGSDSPGAKHLNAVLAAARAALDRIPEVKS